MLGYRVPAPDEAMLVSGGGMSHNDAPFRVVTGHGAFMLPFFRKVRYLTLAMNEAEVAEQCVTKQGIALERAASVIAFKVGNDEEKHHQRGPALPVRPGPDVHPHRPYLCRAPPLDHRLDDRRGDRDRTPEAGQ